MSLIVRARKLGPLKAGKIEFSNENGQLLWSPIFGDCYGRVGTSEFLLDGMRASTRREAERIAVKYLGGTY
ncbi:hypothetical protein GCM10010331_44530 [Streptomyces xanthochromogenes]|uniref:hypothetical protein n=1 Tax=Streptomyces xanthochromogenes TaxID=67384 RepID=UPI00167A1BB8|nr:hypothetical protein [Streptomyces xanthochromogenes]GHB52062.1 hypothetical protein GCM10010331_44530 [Streptomyces xanthochromogenes]